MQSSVRSNKLTPTSSGIGRAVAVLFAREGSDVSISYLPDEQKDAEETKRMVEENEGRRCELIPGDLRDMDMCKQVVEKHMQTFGELHVLVNNASKQYMVKDFAEIDLAQVEDTFRSNVLQMFAVTKFALPHLKKGAS